MSKGAFAFVLHGHLPYVLAHGRWPHGTDWLFEATAETYLPVIRAVSELIDEGFSPRLTVGLSPVLCEQLADDDFKIELVDYLNTKISAAESDYTSFQNTPGGPSPALAAYWRDFYRATLEHFEQINRNILFQFRELQARGRIEIITCGATHGYYPLLSRDESLDVQTRLAVENYRKHFERDPVGIWLPECGYRPRYEWLPPVPIRGRRERYLRKAADEFLHRYDLRFFVIDTPLLHGGPPREDIYADRFATLRNMWERFAEQYAPRQEENDRSPHEAYLVASDVYDPSVTIFTRDPDTGILVWSSRHGYPGDGAYLEFHKKHERSGMRYWAVTSAESDLGAKREYDPSSVAEQIERHASHYTAKIGELLGDHYDRSGRPGILVAPYDAELFGHWWHEGIGFLKETLKRVEQSGDIETTFLSDYIAKHRPQRAVRVPEGSWGIGSHHFIWLNEKTEWTWQYIYEAEVRMVELAQRWTDQPDRQSEQLEKVLKQAGRELLLASASDWQFLITSGSADDYASMRIMQHIDDFRRLAGIADRLFAGSQLARGDLTFLVNCTARDYLFDELEIAWFADSEF